MLLLRFSASQIVFWTENSQVSNVENLVEKQSKKKFNSTWLHVSLCLGKIFLLVFFICFCGKIYQVKYNGSCPEEPTCSSICSRPLFPPGVRAAQWVCSARVSQVMKDHVCTWNAQHVNEWIDNPEFYGIIWSTWDPTTGNSLPLWGVYTLSW